MCHSVWVIFSEFRNSYRTTSFNLKGWARVNVISKQAFLFRELLRGDSHLNTALAKMKTAMFSFSLTPKDMKKISTWNQLIFSIPEWTWSENKNHRSEIGSMWPSIKILRLHRSLTVDVCGAV